MNVDDEWLAFLEDDMDSPLLSSPKQQLNTKNKNNEEIVPKIYDNDRCIDDESIISKNIHPPRYQVIPSELYISTKTKIIYLNKTIDLNNTFWKIPVIHYGVRSNGVIKKQIKLQSFSKDEMYKVLHYVGQHQMQGLFVEQINLHNSTSLPNGTNFKDVRKISMVYVVDILSQRSKKSAFYNCFVLILRISTKVNIKMFM